MLGFNEWTKVTREFNKLRLSFQYLKQSTDSTIEPQEVEIRKKIFQRKKINILMTKQKSMKKSLGPEMLAAEKKLALELDLKAV